MPRRPAKVTQAEIARAVRAAKNAGAAEVGIDSEGQIRVVLSLDAPVVSHSPPKDDGHVWTMSVPGKKKRWSSRDATSWRDIPKRANSDIEPGERYRCFHQWRNAHSCRPGGSLRVNCNENCKPVLSDVD